MFRKPNKEQAVYLAAVCQAVAVGYFAWIGVPALDDVMKGSHLPNSMHTLIKACGLYIMFTLAGYFVLDENSWRNDNVD